MKEEAEKMHKFLVLKLPETFCWLEHVVANVQNSKEEEHFGSGSQRKGNEEHIKNDKNMISHSRTTILPINSNKQVQFKEEVRPRED